MKILQWLFMPDVADWMGDEPQAMIELLRGRASERKLRLFAAACCRRIPESRLCWAYKDAGADEYAWEKILTTSERFADGTGSNDELQAAIELAERVEEMEAWQTDATAAATTAVAVAVAMRPAEHLARGWQSRKSQSVAIEAALQASSQAASAESEELEEARATQAELLREIFGNPFQQVQRSPGWPATDSDPLALLARAIYDDRAFGRLPALAKALERQGCADVDVLSHCRRPGGHVRGCWVVDLILGKA